MRNKIFSFSGFNLLLYLLLLFLLHFLVMNAMYCNLQFHLQLDLLTFGNLLLHFVLLLQIFHLVLLFYILMCLSHLVLLVHTCLYFLFLFVEILLLSKLVFRKRLSKCTQVGVSDFGST